MNDQSSNPPVIAPPASPAPAAAPPASPAPTAAPPSSPAKTPLYQAAHADRYYRQDLIRKIEGKSGRTLICYVAGIEAPIHRDDALGFVELLYNIKKGKDVDLLLHTPGGDIDAAEKLVSLLHATVGNLKVIVPDLAKSAGTLMALGASKIVMSDSSELGPIDPQVRLNDGKGNLIPHSVLHYLDAYDTHTKALVTNPRDVAATIMLNKLDPTTVKLFDAVRTRARELAERQLLRRMFQAAPGQYTKIVSQLMDIKRYPSHGQMISHQDALQMGLEIEYMEPTAELWRMYWQLYCVQRLAITDKGKLFESNYASHAVENA